MFSSRGPPTVCTCVLGTGSARPALEDDSAVGDGAGDGEEPDDEGGAGEGADPDEKDFRGGCTVDGAQIGCSPDDEGEDAARLGYEYLDEGDEPSTLALPAPPTQGARRNKVPTGGNVQEVSGEGLGEEETEAEASE